MKKVLLAALMLFSICSFVTATSGTTTELRSIILKDDGRHIPASQVPNAVLKSFNRHFPNAKNVSWEVDREHGSKVYEAKFKQNGNCKQAEFLSNGSLLEVRNRDCNSGGGSGDD